jgi:hypothetical protein
VIQCTAYRILSQVIHRSTVKLVLEVETSVAEAEDGHAVAPITLPSELVAIMEKGRNIDWTGDISMAQVSRPVSSFIFRFAYTVQVLAQLLAAMAVLDHFEDAVSSVN